MKEIIKENTTVERGTTVEEDCFLQFYEIDITWQLTRGFDFSMPCLDDYFSVLLKKDGQV